MAAISRKGVTMKKIIIMIMLIAIASVAMAVRIETISGITHKGEFVKKVNDMYFIDTRMGSVVVFEQEIERVLSDTGTDITQHFIDMEETEKPETPLQPSPYLITNLSVVSTPLWVFTVASIAYYIYTISKLE